MEKYKDTYNKASDFAKENKGILKTRLDFSKKGEVSVMFAVVDKKGKKLTDSFNAVTFKISEEKNAIYTSGVKNKKK